MSFLVGNLLGFMLHASDHLLMFLERNGTPKTWSTLARYGIGWLGGSFVVKWLTRSLHDGTDEERNRAGNKAQVIHLAAGVIFGSGVVLGHVVDYFLELQGRQ